MTHTDPAWWTILAVLFAAFALAVLVLGLCAAAGRKRPVQYGPREMYGPREPGRWEQ